MQIIDILGDVTFVQRSLHSRSKRACGRAFIGWDRIGPAALLKTIYSVQGRQKILYRFKNTLTLRGMRFIRSRFDRRICGVACYMNTCERARSWPRYLLNYISYLLLLCIV